MTMTEEPTQQPAPDATQWYSLSVDDAVARLGVDATAGLSASEVTSRIAKYGKNEVATEPPPTLWQIAKGQIANPMNIMLLIVSIASFAIEQIATGAIVMALVLFNVIMGTNQERKAMASVDALAQLQVPMARVRRDGSVEEVDSVGLVPGDILLVEAGDLVPADARIISSASLEVQEAALTGESAPIAKDSLQLGDEEQPLGDRTNLVFQNTQVTRGSAELVVVATGQSTQMGQIAEHGVRDAAHQVAAAGRTRRAHEDLRLPRLGCRCDHRDRRHRTRPGLRDADPALRVDGDLGDPDGPPDVRAADALVGSATTRRVESRGQVAQRRRDARRHHGDQQRQDRHAHDERDDVGHDDDRRLVVQGRGQRLCDLRGHSRPRRRTNP